MASPAQPLPPHQSMATPYTPPEQPKIETFSSTVSPLRHYAVPVKTPPATFTSSFHPPSPPVSPESRPSDDKIGLDSAIAGIRDSELFTDLETSPFSRPAVPLFHISIEAGSDTTDDRAASHIREMHSPEPSVESDQLPVTYIVQKIIDTYNVDTRAYIRRELDLLSSYPALVSRPANVAYTKRSSSTFDATLAKRQRLANRRLSIEKRPRAQRAPRQPTVEPANGRGYREHTEVIHRRKPSMSVPHRDDVDYGSLVDYSPPTSSLPHNGKGLKAEWRGHPLDLSSDTDRQHLHDAEISLAATLRLSCAQYLCSKRRIFISRLECLRNGKEFRKTTAQQACKIDVNKASKLWTAFDKVGWFDPRFMVEYV